MQTTILYAALLTLLYLTLCIRVIRLRGKLRIGIGDGGNREMARAIRVHANFAEYTPLALLLLVLVEGQGPPVALLHVLGIGLLAGRMVHAFGLSQRKEDFRFRVAGMVLTFSVLAGSAAYLLFAFLRRAFAG